MKPPALAIMAKQPIVGRTKTRLCPPLTLAQAAALYEALLKDTIALGVSLPDVQLAVAVTPAESIAYFKAITPPDTILEPIEGADIGVCLNQIHNRLFAQGYPKVIAINSDGPTLPPEYLQNAFARLDEVDVVLGPSEDGGYYFIGYTQPHPGLYAGITWSTAQVTPQTLARAAALGLSVAQLPLWYDVDTIADLERLRAELTTLPPERLPHTRAFLRDHLPPIPG